jgi:hypothetical protein
MFRPILCVLVNFAHSANWRSAPSGSVVYTCFTFPGGGLSASRTAQVSAADRGHRAVHSSRQHPPVLTVSAIDPQVPRASRTLLAEAKVSFSRYLTTFAAT